MEARRLSTVAKHLSVNAKRELFRPNRAVNVLDSYIAYVERGSPIVTAGERKCLVFLHGNPSNSYLWRHVVEELEGKVSQRMLCPDLVGFGRSGDSGRGYDFFAHYDYLSAWLDQVTKDEKVTLCVHDWGSALGFHWAKNNPGKVNGIVHMESIVAPLASWDEFPAIGRKAFQTMRETSGAGESMIFEKNFFVEKLLLGEPWASALGEQGCAPYRERFNSQANRAPTLAWPREIPIKNTNSPQGVIDAARNFEAFLKDSTFPKLFIPAKPGFFTPWILEKTKDWKNHTVSAPVKGLHFLQEQSGKDIGQAVAQFLQTHGI